MKKADLMIGDWVRAIDDDTNEAFDATIKAFDSLGNVYVVFPDDDTAYPCSEECVEPIALTTKIFEKNGFNDDGEGIYGDDDSFFVPIYQSEHNDSYFVSTCGRIEAWETHIEPTKGIGDFSGRLRYVHELQHALRLCGIEKEIVL